MRVTSSTITPLTNRLPNYYIQYNKFYRIISIIAYENIRTKIDEIILANWVAALDSKFKDDLEKHPEIGMDETNPFKDFFTEKILKNCIFHKMYML